jgi:hypothetical protein
MNGGLERYGLERYGRKRSWPVRGITPIHAEGTEVNRPGQHSSAVLRSIKWYVPTFRDNLSVASSMVKNSQQSDFLTLEDGANRLYRNVVKEYPLYAA